MGIAAHAEDSHNMQRFACIDMNIPPCYGTGPKGSSESGGQPFAWDEVSEYNDDQ
jgi:hypothetical protein